MRKGLHVTDWDIDLFKYLAFGPAFEKDLHTRFFVGKKGLICRDVFLRRMKRLADAVSRRSAL